jgi:hypothetical protein
MTVPAMKEPFYCMNQKCPEFATFETLAVHVAKTHGAAAGDAVVVPQTSPEDMLKYIV